MKILRNVICVFLALAMFVTSVSAASLPMGGLEVTENLGLVLHPGSFSEANLTYLVPYGDSYVASVSIAELPPSGWTVKENLGFMYHPGVDGARLTFVLSNGDGHVVLAYCTDPANPNIPQVEDGCDYFSATKLFWCANNDNQQLSLLEILKTPEPTHTPTNTPIPTNTPTSTPTETPTSTPTETPTELPTDMPTPTDIPTEIPTDVPTPLPTNTPKPTNPPTEVVETNTPQPVWTPFVVATSGGHTFRYGKIEEIVRTGKVDYVWLVLGSAALLATFGILIKRKRKDNRK